MIIVKVGGSAGIDYDALCDDVAALQRRTHDRGDVMGAVRGKEQRLGPCAHRPVLPVQQQLAHLATEDGATRLPGAHHGIAPVLQPGAQQPGLGGLPGTVTPLEGDEQTPPGTARGGLRGDRVGHDRKTT